MILLDLSDSEASRNRFLEFDALLDVVNPEFEAAAASGHWEVIINSNRQPSRELRKQSESGRTTFLIGVLLDQLWYEVDLEAPLADVLTYTFKIVAVTNITVKSPNAVQQVSLAENQSLASLKTIYGSLLQEALRIVESFDEPPQMPVIGRF